jgi:hypothetical protein
VRVESWSDALRRFYGTTDADAELTVPIRSGDRREESERARVETWAEALRRFYGTTDDESR